MTWLWPKRFAIGELGILAGLPDEGKGQVFAFMTATVTRGGAWPCDEGTASSAVRMMTLPFGSLRRSGA